MGVCEGERYFVPVCLYVCVCVSYFLLNVGVRFLVVCSVIILSWYLNPQEHVRFTWRDMLWPSVRGLKITREKEVGIPFSSL